MSDNGDITLNGVRNLFKYLRFLMNGSKTSILRLDIVKLLIIRAFIASKTKHAIPETWIQDGRPLTSFTLYFLSYQL